MMFADLVRDQTRQQFAHPRSALLPGFALPHLLAVVAFALCSVVLTPAILSMTLGTDFLLTTAVASATFAVASAQYRFTQNPIIQPLFPMLVAFALFGLYRFVALPLQYQYHRGHISDDQFPHTPCRVMDAHRSQLCQIGTPSRG